MNRRLKIGTALNLLKWDSQRGTLERSFKAVLGMHRSRRCWRKRISIRLCTIRA